MKTSPLRTARLFLILLLSGIILYLLGAAFLGIIPMILKVEGSFESISRVVLLFFMYGFLILIPSIMLHSLITKKLNGFASCLGLFICFSAFFLAVTLPNKLGLMALWDSLSFIPIPIKALVGLAMAVLFLILPFWILFRLMRWTNDWLYLKVLKPLEQKI